MFAQQLDEKLGGGPVQVNYFAIFNLFKAQRLLQFLELCIFR